MDQEHQKTLENLDFLIEKGQQKKARSTWGYLVGSLVFPPFGLIVSLILAWKKGVLHLALPKIAIVFSLLSGISIPLTYFAIKPLAAISGGLSQNQGYTGSLLFLSLLILILAIIGLVLGFDFAKRAKVEGKISGSAILFLIAILLVQHVILAINIYLVNSVIYGQIDTIIQK